MPAGIGALLDEQDDKYIVKFILTSSEQQKNLLQ